MYSRVMNTFWERLRTDSVLTQEFDCISRGCFFMFYLPLLFYIVCERESYKTCIILFFNAGMMSRIKALLTFMSGKDLHLAVTLLLSLSNRECGAGTFVNFASLEREGKLPYSW